MELFTYLALPALACVLNLQHKVNTTDHHLWPEMLHDMKRPQLALMLFYHILVVHITISLVGKEDLILKMPWDVSGATQLSVTNINEDKLRWPAHLRRHQ